MTITSLADTRVFNNPDVIVEGWYWALKSAELKPGRAAKVKILTKDLVVYRTKSGALRAFDAHCPHMGAHLGEGTVDGDGIRCAFHGWKFESSGQCSDIPCNPGASPSRKLKSWPVEEKYGLIWVYAGEQPRVGIPVPPDLASFDHASTLGRRFVKECHPSVMMINAIDAQHFATVHPMAGGLASHLNFAVKPMGEHVIEFRNANPPPANHWIPRLVSRFYKEALTYWMTYWYSSTGTVTLGPDFLRFYIIFALRPTLAGHSEGWPIFVTKKRTGLIGAIVNPVVLMITRIVSGYFAHGDTKIFRSIRFRFETPIQNDSAIVKFIHHTEHQTVSVWTRNEDKPGAFAASGIVRQAASSARPALKQTKDALTKETDHETAY